MVGGDFHFVGLSLTQTTVRTAKRKILRLIFFSFTERYFNPKGRKYFCIKPKVSGQILSIKLSMK